MQGFLIVGTLVALVASLVVMMTRQPHKPQPVKMVAQPKRRQLRRPKERQKRYYQRRIRMLQQQHMALFLALLYHQYRAEQATTIYN